MPRIPGLRRIFRLDGPARDIGRDVDDELAFHLAQLLQEPIYFLGGVNFPIRHLGVVSGLVLWPIKAMSMGTGSALYDTGFYNIGVTPTTDDLG